ncbi:hypothetical protein [Streptodolium elevatio]|uniref:Uncharacterized protein n=1 Tax=Streptodolium elevatio TaxID=3157996 RepID=A0ABV3DSB6_9ACTN
MLTLIAIAASIGLAYAAIRRHQGTRWSEAFVDGVKGFAATVGFGVFVVAFIWMADTTTASTASSPSSCAAAASPPH